MNVSVRMIVFVFVIVFVRSGHYVWKMRATGECLAADLGGAARERANRRCCRFDGRRAPRPRSASSFAKECLQQTGAFV